MSEREDALHDDVLFFLTVSARSAIATADVARALDVAFAADRCSALKTLLHTRRIFVNRRDEVVGVAFRVNGAPTLAALVDSIGLARGHVHREIVFDLAELVWEPLHCTSMDGAKICHTLDEMDTSIARADAALRHVDSNGLVILLSHVYKLCNVPGDTIFDQCDSDVCLAQSVRSGRYGRLLAWARCMTCRVHRALSRLPWSIDDHRMVSNVMTHAIRDCESLRRQQRLEPPLARADEARDDALE